MKILLILIILCAGCASNHNNYVTNNETIQNIIPKTILDTFKEEPFVKPEAIVTPKLKLKKNNIKNRVSNKIDQVILTEPPAIKVPFSLSETLSYKVYLKGIKIGEISFSIANEGQSIQNKEIIKITSTLKSTGLIGAIYKINTKATSFVDKNMFFSYKYIVTGQEGSTIKNNYEIFDSVNHKGFYFFSETKDGVTQSGSKEFPMVQYPQDLLSIFYYIRTLPLSSGYTKELNISTKDKNKIGLLSVSSINKDLINIDFSLQGESNKYMTLEIKNHPEKIISKINLFTKIGELEMILN